MNATARRRVTWLGWAARVLSLLTIGMFLMFAFGEDFNPFRLGPRELLLFLFFPLGVGVGLVLGWWREGLGGLVALGSLALFYVVHAIPHHKFPGGPWFLVFASPGVLFLLSWLLNRGRHSEAEGEHAGAKGTSEAPPRLPRRSGALRATKPGPSTPHQSRLRRHGAGQALDPPAS